MEKTFAMISLGCAKNLVNSEQMLYLLSEAAGRRGFCRGQYLRLYRRRQERGH